MVYSVDIVCNSVTWHARLEHIGKDRMASLAKKGLLEHFANISLLMCEPF